MPAISSSQLSEICVLIPTYNNAKSLQQVIDSVLIYCPNVCVVNDGSTDETSEILNTYSDKIIVLTHDKNYGKGYAIKTGFNAIRNKGFRYTITLDSDGQHFAEDIPIFITFIEKNPDTLLIGSRNFNQPHIKRGSLFANKFSNFWIFIQTWYHLPDTQSGFRLYPLKKMKKISPFCHRYEAEIELLVRSAWKGIRLMPIPIQVFYPKKEERVSHFRPKRDFLRISLLNTLLCFVAVIYGYPSLFVHFLTKHI